jgi:hypothetical protein
VRRSTNLVAPRASKMTMRMASRMVSINAPTRRRESR